MAASRPRRFQVSLGSLLLLMSVTACGAALLGTSIALGGAFVIVAFVASMRTVRVVRHRRVYGTRTTCLTTASDFLYSFWILVCLIVLSSITLVFMVVMGTIHFSIKCWIACRRLVNFLRVSSILSHFFRILNRAWLHLLTLDHRVIRRLSPSFGLPNLHCE